jgi:hypothetical protein
MNRELLSIVPDTPVEVARELLRAYGVGAVPVLDDERRPLGVLEAPALLDATGRAAERMTRPAPCVDGSTSVEDAAKELAKAGTHHLVVVDTAGVAVGILSVLDVLRAIMRLPARHPLAFPHWDEQTHTSWTDDWPLQEECASHAPDEAGVLVLVRPDPRDTDAAVWVEECLNVRHRVEDLADPSCTCDATLACILHRGDVRFRAAAVHDVAERQRIVSLLRDDIEHRPPPGAT